MFSSPWALTSSTSSVPFGIFRSSDLGARTISSTSIDPLSPKKVMLQAFFRSSRLYGATQQIFQNTNVYLLDFSSTYRYHPDLGTDIKTLLDLGTYQRILISTATKSMPKLIKKTPTVESSSNSLKSMDTSAETSSPK